MLVSCPVDNRPDGSPRLYGKLKIKISPNSLAYSLYHKASVDEAFNCNYELNTEYRAKIEAAGLRVSGVTKDGGARIIELPGHTFYIATGFVPQFSSKENKPHPLILAYLEAALSVRKY